jgi:uridine kinase
VGFPSTVIDEVARAICRAERPPGVATILVAIDGFGGAGKSTFAAQLAEHLGVEVVHTDDFASWEVPLEWWPRLLEEVLSPLVVGDPARFQRYDWDARALAEWHEIEPSGIVLVEGVSSSRDEFRPYLSYAVWIDTPRDVRLRRGLERDGVDAADQWANWMADEDAWAAAQLPQFRTNVVVTGMS